MRLLFKLLVACGFWSMAYHTWIGLADYDQIFRWLVTFVLALDGLNAVVEGLSRTE